MYFEITLTDGKKIHYFPKLYNINLDRNYTKDEIFSDFIAMRYVKIDNKIYYKQFFLSAVLIEG